MNISKIWIPALLIAISFSSCDLIGDIFEAGIWVGVIIVVLIIVAVIWLLKALF